MRIDTIPQSEYPGCTVQIDAFDNEHALYLTIDNRPCVTYGPTEVAVLTRREAKRLRRAIKEWLDAD